MKKTTHRYNTIKTTKAKKVAGGQVFTMNITQTRKPDIYKDGFSLAALRGNK